MKFRKLVDTIENYGAAERHIFENADFERFLKKEYGRKSILDVEPKTIVKKFHLKGIVFGNYVTQEERFHFVHKIEKQLEVLAKLAGTNNLGKDKLIIAFGVEGMPRALAHFSSSKQLINLNRGRKGDYRNILQGENSFIHEYAHFIDCNQGHNDHSIKVSTNWATKATEGGTAKTKMYSKLVDDIESDTNYMEGLNKFSNKKYLRKRYELFARLFESAITHHVVDKMKTYEPYFREAKYNGPWYNTKADILKRGLDKKCIEVLKTINPSYKVKEVAKKTQPGLNAIELENRTFSKDVQRIIADKLKKVKSIKKVSTKLVRLLNEDKKTVALWEKTRGGSRIVINSWY